MIHIITKLKGRESMWIIIVVENEFDRSICTKCENSKKCKWISLIKDNYDLKRFLNLC